MRRKRPNEDAGASGEYGTVRRSVDAGKRTLTQGLVRRKEAGRGDAGPTSLDEAATAAIAGKGSGVPLDAGVRARVEPALGADLGDVRVHADAGAAQASQDLGARAFTHGSDIFLGGGEQATDVQLMAHEATHVVQQRGGGTSTQALAHVGEASDPAEREADQVAARVAQGDSSPQTISADAGGAVRRDVDPSTVGTDGEKKTEEVQEGEAFIKGAGDKHEISPNDVDQGQLGDCWLLGGLQAIARANPDLIKNMIKPAGDGKWSVTFHFPKGKDFVTETVTVDAKVPVNSKGGRPTFANTGDVKDGKKELWVLLIEKAYAKTQGKYADIAGSKAPGDHYAMEIVSGKKNGRIDYTADEDTLLTQLDLALSAGKAVTLGTISKKHAKAPFVLKEVPVVHTNHTYTLDTVDKAGKKVGLLNPWGYDHLPDFPIEKVKKYVDEIFSNG